MKDKFIEFLIQWKFGAVVVRMKTSVSVKSIIMVDQLVEELPEHQDGVNTRISLLTGLILLSPEKYEDVMEKINDTLGKLNDS